MFAWYVHCVAIVDDCGYFSKLFMCNIYVIMEERREDLIELHTYINGVDNEVTMILQSLQWDRKHLLESTPLVSCKHDSSHKVPPDKKAAHEALCWLKLEGYTEDDLKDFTQNGEDIGESLLPSLRRAGPLSTADRLALHCAAVAAAPAPRLDGDLTLPGEERESKRDGEGDGAGADPRLIELALQRDLRRRRTKYRVAKTKNYSDVLRDVIQTQMEFYTGNTEDDTEDTDSNRQDKIENNYTQITTNREPNYNENSRYNRIQKRYTQDSSHSKHSSRYDENEHNTSRSRKTDEYTRETRRSGNHRYEREYRDNDYDYRQERNSRNDKQCSNRDIKQGRWSRSKKREERHSRRYKEYSSREIKKEKRSRSRSSSHEIKKEKRSRSGSSSREIKKEKRSRSRERDRNQKHSRRNRRSRSEEFYSHNDKNERLTRSIDDDKRREDRRKRRSRERSDKKSHSAYKISKEYYIQVKEERQSSSEETSSDDNPEGSYYRPKEYEYEHHEYDKSDRYGHSSKKKDKHHHKKHYDDNTGHFKYDSRKKSNKGYYDVYVKEEPDDF